MGVLRADDAITHEIHGARFHSYVAPARGSAELCAWRLEVPAGTVGVPHEVSREEVVLLLTGRLTATIAGVAEELEPGDVAFVPAGASFGIENRSGEPATAWVTTGVGLTATLSDGSTLSPPWTR